MSVNFKRCVQAVIYILACLFAYSCSVERPGVGNSAFNSPLFFHSATSLDCANCHEKDRPAPKDGVKHGGGKDCVACHKSSDVRAGWLPTQIFTHSPTPLTTCLPCHSVDRPAPPHNATDNCVQCHTYPTWKK